ncbi:guanine deaminase [Prosthecomicrobium sp. N25]|uniref:guanine deaminase n=1 Tax=Prosthecomicrobium sp. N25 TaxID=3129254 RepID=UPI00307765F7
MKLMTGRVLDFTGDPALEGDGAVRYAEHGGVLIGDDGRIAWSGPMGELPPSAAGVAREDWGEAILTAGFVDAHIHFPQYRMLAAPGRDLLDWLARFTFPEEARFAEQAHAEVAAGIFLDRLLAHGTTAALVFSSVHKVAAEALFAAAEARGMALATGKTMMDRNAPAAVTDDPETGGLDSEALIGHWHKRGRLVYAISPRFAITSSEAQLAVSGALLKAHPDCLMQTHLSESRREIETVAALFPNDRDYTAVYERHGLLGPTSLFAHGIHLSDDECRRLSESGSAVVHCPTSNTFLGSGLFDLAHVGAPHRPVGFGLATDVGGGTSYSMLATMGEAHKVAMLAGRRLPATRSFYLATLGNARLMHLGAEIGSLDAGKWADLTILDPRATPLLAARDDLSESLEDRLFALAVLGDDRAVAATYVAGREVYRKA